MTDSWEKRPLPHCPGYNSPAATVVFTPEWNNVTDELVITASEPVFGAVDEINYQGSAGNGTINAPADFTVDSSTQITVPSAVAIFGGPTELTQLDYYSPGPTLVGIWTGIHQVGVATLTASYDSGTDELSITATSDLFVGDIDYIFTYCSISAGDDQSVPDFTIVSPTELVIPSYRATENANGFVRYVGVYKDGLVGPFDPLELIGEAVDISEDVTTANRSSGSTITAPADDEVQVTGVRFLTAGVGAVTAVQVQMTNIADISYLVSDPEITLTDTLLTVNDPALDGGIVNAVRFTDPMGTYLVSQPNDATNTQRPAYPVVP